MENPTSYQPEIFEAFIGGFMGTSYGVKWENGALRYDELGHGYTPKSTTLLKPTVAEWQDFWNTLDALNVWNWKTEYFQPVCDGTNWRLRAQVAGRQIESHGSNDFPDNDGDDAFAKFCAAVSKLAGGREFR